MKRILIAFALLVTFGVAPALADPPNKSDDVVAHLKSRGYDATADNQRLTAKHETHLNLFMKQYRGGILVTSFFGGNDYGKAHRNEFLAVVNQLNENAAAARYYVTPDGNLAIEGYYPGDFNAVSFSAFMDAFELEKENIQRLIGELGKFVD